MKLTLISESSPQLGIGNTMHLSSFLNRLKFRILEANHDLVVIDATWIPHATIRWHQENEAKVIIFNNLNEESNSLADIAVNGEWKGFHNLVHRREQNVHFLGPKYLFLREEFLKRQNDYGPQEVRYIGIMLGGSDPLGITEKVKQELCGKYIVTSVRGVNIAAQMANVELMLTGCGIGFWESLAVGTPAIPFAANQEHIDYYSPSFKLGQPGKLKEMIANREYTMPDPKWEIGQGWEEVIEEILR